MSEFLSFMIGLAFGVMVPFVINWTDDATPGQMRVKTSCTEACLQQDLVCTDFLFDLFDGEHECWCSPPEDKAQRIAVTPLSWE